MDGTRRNRSLGIAILGACALLFATPTRSLAAPVKSESGHTYVEQGGEWYLVAPSAESLPESRDATSAIQAQDEQLLRVDTRRIVVRLDSRWNEGARGRLGLHGNGAVGRLLPGGYRVVKVPPGREPMAFLRTLESTPGVRWARFDLVATYFSTPNDSLYSSQWGMSEAVSRLPSAWNFTTGSGIKVGVIDSGIDASHPEFSGAIDVDSGIFATIDDTYGHGTPVAGIIAARTNNSIGVAGVAGDAELLILNAGHSPTTSILAEAVVFAADNGARVINMSVGICGATDSSASELADAIAYATDETRDVVVVCASGNGGPGCKKMAYPATRSDCIAVRAIEEAGTFYGLYGSSGELDLLAPGGSGITTTDRQDVFGLSLTDYTCSEGATTCFGGTSAAAPFVAGVAALVRAANPSLDRSEVRDILIHSADKVAAMGSSYSTNEHGYGKVNALGAVVGALHDAQLVQGTYSTSQTWPSTTKPFHNLYFPGDVLVASGATVTVTPKTDISGGVQCLMATSDAADLESGFTDKVEWIVKGTLDVNGTSSRRVTMKSIASSPTENDWAHVYVLANGNLDLDYADVKHSQYGVSSSSNGSLIVTNSAFLSNSSTDMKLGGTPSSLDVSGNSFTVGGGTGVEVSTPSGSIEGNTFSGISSGAIGIKADGASMAVTVTGNVIGSTGAGTGILLGAGSAVVTDNTIDNLDRGIQVNSGPHTIGGASDGNTIENSNYGLYAQCAGPGSCPASCAPLFATVRFNTFDSNDTQVHTVKTAAVDLGNSSEDGNNSFLDSDSCSVNNTSSCGTISAIGNWWGSCAAPSDLCGSVDASDHLCAPPGGSLRTLEPMAGGTIAILGFAPNPARNGTHLHFRLDTPATDVAMSVYDVAGRRVRLVRGGALAAGDHALRWDGRNDQGVRVSEGIYFARLRAGTYELESKVLVVTP